MSERLGSPSSPTARSSAWRAPSEPWAAAASARRGAAAGWRRSWSQARDNLRSEKTFALADGTHSRLLPRPQRRAARRAGAQRALIEITEEELDRLAVREIRYDRVEVTAEIAADGPLDFDRVVTFTAKPSNYAASPPPGAVILASYARAVEAAFESLGPGQLELFRETTDPRAGRGRRGRAGPRPDPRRQSAGVVAPRLGGVWAASLAFQCCAQARSSRIAGRRALPFSVSA